MNMKMPFRKSGARFRFLSVIAICVLLLVTGCAGNKLMETIPAPAYSPITVTNPPDESKIANSTNSPPARRLSRPQRLQEARAPIFYKPEQESSDYDEALIASVQQHWYELLDRSEYDRTTKGEVTLEFRLEADGSISDIEVVQTTVSAQMTALCKQAIIDGAPFQRWPTSMRLQMDTDYRKIQFKFDFD